MDKTRGVAGGHKIKREEGWGWRWGASCLASLGRTCSWRGTAGNCYCSGDKGNNKGGSMDKKLADLANMRRKETREDQDNANKRGGRSPVRRSGNLDRRVMQGQ
jgi:hypothetical protein